LTKFDWVIVLLTLTSVLLIPTIALVLRIVVKWTRTEAKLERIADDLKELVADKDKTHNEMLTTMREDRAATDRRLRWLEENLWKRGKPNAI